MNAKEKSPHAALRFLEWYCPPKLYEGIAGDLLEKFYNESDALGEEEASKRLWWGVIKFFRPGIVLRN
jgi:putative ABC transport system permease protein